MSETEGQSKKIVQYIGDEQTKELGLYTRAEVKEWAYRIGYVLGTQNLTVPQQVALAQGALMVGANPVLGEIYYMPNRGVHIGYQYWDRRGAEQMERERLNAKVAAAKYYVNYREPTKEEVAHLKLADDDIALVAVLTDDLSTAIWEQRITNNIVKLVGAGIPWKDAKEYAEELAGDAPKWEALAVVRGNEKFGSATDQEKYDRRERCKKRCRTLVIKQRFPEIREDRVGLDKYNFQSADLPSLVEEIEQEKANKPKHTESENLIALGFAPLSDDEDEGEFTEISFDEDEGEFE